MATYTILAAILLFLSLVSSRPYTTYCSLPCPLTQPCSDPFYTPVSPQPSYSGSVQGASNYAGAYATRVCPSGSLRSDGYITSDYNSPSATRKGEESQPQCPAKQKTPSKEPDRNEPKPKKPKDRRPGLLTSLFSIPGVIADTVLSGEITIP